VVQMIFVCLIFKYQPQSIEKYIQLFSKLFSFVIRRWPDEYKVGLTKNLLLDINVINTGENAYDTRCFVQLPSGVEYVSSNSSSIVREK